MKLFKQSLKKKILLPREICPYFVVSTAMFAFFTFIGFLLIEINSDLVDETLGHLEGLVESLSGLGAAGLVAFIFFNNILVAILASLGGVLVAVLPLIIIISNGVALGIVLNLMIEIQSFGLFLAGVLPHGVIELPAIFFASAVGLWLGTRSIKCLVFRSKENRLELTEGLKRASRSFLYIIMPLIFLATLVEVFITPLIMYYFFPEFSGLL
ncbi:MAG: stage II sporulation protein M [Candidatus Paceibacterota bacterium]